MGEETSANSGERTRTFWPDIVGISWILIAAGLALLPALIHGPFIGSFDALSKVGLTARPGVIVHNPVAGDISDEVVPWIQAAWIQVHQGHFPLWTRNEALGMPLAFNFGSGAFSLPALVSYLTPLRLVFWVQILVSLIVGGTGAYFFGRVLRLHPVACAFAGTTWVLSGPFWGYLGLPDTSVMSWAGWQFAAVVLILRGRHRLWSVVLFAVSFAFSILAGNPQIEVLIVLALGVFVIVVLLWRRFVVSDNGPLRQPIVDLALATIAGGALSAPLVLPGIQLANASVRTKALPLSPNPPSQVLGLIFQSFWGQPIAGSFADKQGFFEEQWLYVGAIALALSVVAVAIRWRRPEVVGLAAAAVIVLLASISEPMDKLLESLPAVGQTWWVRGLIPLAFCMAMLGAVGLDALIKQAEQQRAARWALGAFAGIAVLLALVWVFARGNLPAYTANVRAKSFIWPAVSTVVGFAACVTLLFAYRRIGGRRWTPRGFRTLTLGIAGALLICQTVFLVVDDGPIPSSSPTMYQPTPAVSALQRAVGSALVGLGHLPGKYAGLDLGIGPDANIAYGVDEFAVYDPIVPLSYFTAWNDLYGPSAGVAGLYEFIPTITSAHVARRYGISYVLEPHGSAGPSGSVFDRRIGDEDLYRIPGSARATLVPASSVGWPSVDAPGKAVPLKWPGPAQARVVTNASSPQVLRLRVSSVPGWKATIDGQPLALSPYLTSMLQARIPPGKHIIELHYWPNRFTAGLVIAAGTVVVLGAVGIVARRRKRRLGPREESRPDDESTERSGTVMATPAASVT